MAIVIRVQESSKVSDISEFLPFQPNADQREALRMIKDFIDDTSSNVFILTGAAGTGKTSIMKAVISYINGNLDNFNLLAPTGRAANIIGNKANFYSSTIHSHIYNLSEIKDKDGRVVKLEFIRKSNIKSYKEVFLVDEASMISEIPGESEQFVSSNSLLHDFMAYVKEGNVHNKVIFIGDNYQLPPVDSNESRALDPEYLRNEFGVNVKFFELKEVMRQANDSYVLQNAQYIKNAINTGTAIPQLKFADWVKRENTIEEYVGDLMKHGYSKSIVLAWTNKTNEDINKQVRLRLFPNTQHPVCVGEHLILSQGYYTKDAYIPNGTFVKVSEILNTEENIAGFRFLTVKLINSDTGKELSGSYKLNVDFLLSGQEAMDAEKMKLLWHDRYRVNKDLQKSKNKIDDAYLSALQVKYAYAITVHKAQGGEWDHVYLHPERPSGLMAKRLLYTAVTRSKKELISIQRF